MCKCADLQICKFANKILERRKGIRKIKKKMKIEFANVPICKFANKNTRKAERVVENKKI
jgi:hypothetical protein